MDFKKAKDLFPHPHADYVEQNLMPGLDSSVQKVRSRKAAGKTPVRIARYRPLHRASERAEAEG